MFEVKKIGMILEPTNLEFERKAVLNPACYQDGEFVHMFYRAVNDDGDSCIGYAKLKGPTEVVERWDRPIIMRDYPYEIKGVEDPRIVNIDGTFYMTYVAHDGKNAITAYATSADLKTFKKEGIISPQITYHDATDLFKESSLRIKDSYFFFASFYEEEAGAGVLVWHKDVILFPKKIGGRFVIIHRILPDIQILFFDDFSELTTEFWQDYLRKVPQHVVLENKHWFETRHIGGGAPPIETSDGWLFITHGAEETNKQRVYHAGAALLDIVNPQKVLGKLHEPLFSPTEPWEISGLVSNVVFPTGTAIFGDMLYIYYGAADRQIAVASVSLPELLKELKNPTQGHAQRKGTK